MTRREVTKYAGTVVSDDAVGTLAWSNPGDAAGAPGDDAATADGAGQTEYLLATAFGLDLPSTATPAVCRFIFDRIGAPIPSTITRRDAEDTSAAASTSISVNTPDTEEGDVIVALLGTNADTDHTPSQSGWTHIGRAEVNGSQTVEAFYRIATASEPSSYGFTKASAATIASLISYANVDADNVLGSDVSTTDNTSSGTSHPSAEVTTVAAGCMLIKLDRFTSSPGTVTPPGGLEYAEPNSGNARAYDGLVSTAGATGTKTTTTTNNVQSCSIMFALRPLPTPEGRVEDEALRLVVDGVVDDTDLSLEDEWDGDEYREDQTALIDVSGVSVSDLNSTDSGVALSAEVATGIRAGVRAVEWWLRYDIAVDVTVVDPTAEGTISWSNATVEIEAEIASTSVTINRSRWRIYADAEGDRLVYDSGLLTSTALTHAIGSGTPALPWSGARDGGTYWLQVYVREDGDFDGAPIEGTSALHEFSIDASMTTVTGLAVEPITEEES